MTGRIRVLRWVIAEPRLRRVAVAFLGFGAAEYGVWVAVLVFAYNKGGTTLAAVAAVVQLIPAALLGPAGAEMTQRRGAAAALRISYVVQAVALALTGAAFMLGSAPAVGFAAAALAACAVTLTRPAQGALLPQLTDTPSRLTAANVVVGWVESVSLLLGPVIAGALIALDGPGAAILVFALVVLAGAIGLSGERGGRTRTTESGVMEIIAEHVALMTVVRRHPRVVAVCGLFLVQFIAEGALDVLVVVLAVKVLALGSPAAGYLQASFGAGAVIGAGGALLLVGRRRLTAPLLAAAACWGAAYVVLSLWHSVGAAFGLIAVAGASRAVFDVSGRTLLHRVVPAEIHGRVFALLEAVSTAGLAIGSISVGALVALGGAPLALAGIGALMILGAATLLGTIGGLDVVGAAPPAEMALLRGSRLFGMLPVPVLEDLARALVRREVAPGEVLIHEGEHGEEFYLPSAGELEVTIGGESIRTIRPGDGFGEIALLRDGRRTATITARGPATVHALSRAWFLEAVTGSDLARHAAEDVIATRVFPVLPRP